MTHTHSYVELEISKEAWDEIAGKLRAVDYDYVFSDDGRVIDMQGIALVYDDGLVLAPGTKL